jgi:hypothetical protein
MQQADVVGWGVVVVVVVVVGGSLQSMSPQACPLYQVPLELAQSVLLSSKQLVPTQQADVAGG